MCATSPILNFTDNDRHRILILYNKMDADRYEFAKPEEIYPSRWRNFTFDIVSSDEFKIRRWLRELDRYSAVAISTNFLNEPDCSQIYFDEFRDVLKTWLERGGSLLFLHQNRITQRTTKLSEILGIPEITGTLKRRADGESATDASVCLQDIGTAKSIARYPLQANLDRYQSDRYLESGMRGAYWLYIDDLEPTQWTPIHIDDRYKRVLSCQLRNSTHGNIIISTIPFDWHGEINQIINFLSWMISDGQFIFLKQHRLMGDNLKLIDSLFQDFRFITYQTTASLDESEAWNAIVVYDESASDTSAFQNLYRIGLKEGEVSITLPSISRDLRQAISELMLRIEMEVADGLVSSNLWETIATIRPLLTIPQFDVQSRSKQVCKTIFERLPTGATYDGIWGQTAALWFFSVNSESSASRSAQIENWLLQNASAAKNLDIRWLLYVSETPLGRRRERFRKLLFSLFLKNSDLHSSAPDAQFFPLFSTGDGGKYTIDEVLDNILASDGRSIELLRDLVRLFEATAGPASIMSEVHLKKLVNYGLRNREALFGFSLDERLSVSSLRLAARFFLEDASISGAFGLPSFLGETIFRRQKFGGRMEFRASQTERLVALKESRLELRKMRVAKELQRRRFTVSLRVLIVLVASLLLSNYATAIILVDRFRNRFGANWPIEGIRILVEYREFHLWAGSALLAAVYFTFGRTFRTLFMRIKRVFGGTA